MCTCIFLKGTSSYFGRNMDFHYSFNEQVINIKRGKEFELKKAGKLKIKYSLLGIGTIRDGYPLFSDVMNEKGLAFAGLNFLNNARYNKYKKSKVNIAPYELPLFLLGNCSNIDEVKDILRNLNLLNEQFSLEIPLAYLHFMISDLEKSIVIESTKDGLKIYDNDLNVLTNNPEFTYHKNNIFNYINLSIEDPINSKFNNISYGQGLIGLPGDYSSMSRFIKSYFVKENIILSDNPINQFFYCLDSVFMPYGLVKAKDDFEYTRYQSCYDLKSGEMYYKSYNDRSIKNISFLDFTSNEDIEFFQLINI